MSTTPHPAAPLAAAPAAPLAPPRPRSSWALAAAAWRTYMAHRATFLLPVLLVEVPMLIGTVSILALLDPGPLQMNGGWIFGFTIFTLVHSVLTLTEAVLAFILLAVIAVQIRAGFAGRGLSLGEAFRAVLPRLWALLGGSFLLVLSVGLLTVIGVVLSVVFTLVLAVVNASAGGLAEAIRQGMFNNQNLWFQLLLLSLVTAAAMFLVVKWSLMVQVVVLEDAPPVDSLRRSWQIVTGSFWRTLGLLLLGMLPLTLLSNGTLVVEFFDLLPATNDRVLVLALARGIGLLVRMVLLPWALALLTLYYYDLRLRRDGSRQ